MIRFPVTNKFETVKFENFAASVTYKFEKVASDPVKLMVDATLRACVLMYGIVKVSKKKVAFAAFAVIEPFTLNVS